MPADSLSQYGYLERKFLPLRKSDLPADSVSQYEGMEPGELLV